MENNQLPDGNEPGRRDISAIAAGTPAPTAPDRQIPFLTESQFLAPEDALLSEKKPFLRWYWNFSQRAYPFNDIPPGAQLRALDQIAQFAQNNQPSPSPGTAGGLWTNIGPAPIQGGQIGSAQVTRPMSGRVSDIAVDPGNSNRWLIGTAQGGIWETTNAGASWTQKTDNQASLATGAIAFAPSNPNTIYAGTGEAVFSGDAYGGAGLLKSTDGGTTWQLLAAPTFAKTTFSDIKVNPTNADTLLAATVTGIAGRGGGFPPSIPPTGIFKSTDGGVTWSQRLNGRATDLEINPSNFNNQYAGIGDIFGGASNGVYRSTNAGDTWTPIAGPWSSVTGGVGRVELAVAPFDPNVVYVSIQDAFGSGGNDSRLLGIWRTSNAWDATPTWTQIPTAALSSNAQWWYDHEISVDPTDPNILYAGGVGLWKYNGSSWTEVSKTASDPANGIHVDQHTMAWVGNRLIVGNDGGVWSTTDGGNTWADHNTNLSITQYYEGSLHPTDPNFALGGSQDNGTHKWTGTNAWPWIWFGDGADNAISKSDPNNDWAISSQGLNIVRTTNGGASFTGASGGIDKTGAPFIARFEKSPHNDDIFIAGTDNLWKTTNFFSAPTPSWVSNSPDVGSISALAFAPSDTSSNTYGFGTATGQLRLTTNGGTNWTDIDISNAVPNRYVTDIAFDPTNANTCFISLSGFDEGTPGQPGHLFKTTNALSGAPTWFNVSPPVNIPHNTIAIDPTAPDSVYVGTDIGVWQSSDGGNTWNHNGPETGMPNVAVFELEINRTTNKAIAFTHGRGVLALDLAATSSGQIAGIKWKDQNGNGVKDASEPGLPGWTIFLDTDSDGILDPGETSSTTDADGNYSFTGLGAGTYKVAEVLQNGWQQTSPTTPANKGFETGDFTSWQTLGNTSIQTAAYGATPTNGTYDALITNGVGSVSDADLETFLGSGAGSLDGLGNGDATEGSVIKQTILVPAGAKLTFDWNFLTNQATPSSFNDFAFVSIGSNPANTLANTNNSFVTSPTIFEEETGFGTFSQTFTTAGTYTVAVGVVDVGDTGIDSGLLVDNFSVTDDAGNPLPGSHTVTINPGETVKGVDFGNKALSGEIKGIKWNDQNGDRVQDPDEPGLANWTIYLDANQNSKLDQGEIAVVTDADGNYAFTKVEPGTYTVAEVVQNGWQQTSPVNPTNKSFETGDFTKNLGLKPRPSRTAF